MPLWGKKRNLKSNAPNLVLPAREREFSLELRRRPARLAVEADKSPIPKAFLPCERLAHAVAARDFSSLILAQIAGVQEGLKNLRRYPSRSRQA